MLNNKEIIDTITHLMEISVKAKSSTGTDVFVNYAPHVNSVEVQVHLNGWHNDKKGIDIGFLYFDRVSTEDTANYIARVEKVIAEGKTREQVLAEAKSKIAELDKTKRKLRREIKKLEANNA